jgi:hypothetical protein
MRSVVRRIAAAERAAATEPWFPYADGELVRLEEAAT